MPSHTPVAFVRAIARDVALLMAIVALGFGAFGRKMAHLTTDLTDPRRTIRRLATVRGTILRLKQKSRRRLGNTFEVAALTLQNFSSSVIVFSIANT